MYLSTAFILSLSSAALARPIHSQPRQTALDFGSCGSPEIEFANGLDGRSEPSFQAVNQKDFNHGSADNIAIIANFICGQLQTKCEASAATVSACDAGTKAAAQATAGAAADAFNAALGINSDFAAGPVNGNAAASTQGASAAAGAASGAAAATTTDAAGSDAAATASNSAAAATGTAAAAAAATGALDTGSCGSPEIEFANGLDGRKEPSFQAVNQQDFNHGSADNIGIIANFVCQQLSTKCKASADTVAACNSGTQAAAQNTAGAAADAFNAALGISSNFAAGPVNGSASAAAAAATAASSTNSAADDSAANAASSTATAAAAASTGAAAAATQAASGGNLQTFTGSLGATAPAVTASGNGQFQVDGNASFNNLQNALVRDVQHNQCADAANASGNKGSLTVAACGTQQDQCNTAAQSTAAAQ